jgi:hypothetical protein
MQNQEMLGYFTCPAGIFLKTLKFMNIFLCFMRPALLANRFKDFIPVTIRANRVFHASELSCWWYGPAGSQFCYWKNPALPRQQNPALWRSAPMCRADSASGSCVASFALLYGQ